MGNTLLQSTMLYSSGKLLLESFEFSTWLTDQAWTVKHGTPVNSSAVAKDGVFSFIMDASYPAISKVVAANGFGWCVVYFYDDATQTASTFKPGVLWDLFNTTIIGVGVSNATTTGFYTLWNNGVLSATAVARTTGWHRFMITNGGTQIISIDGTAVLSASISPLVGINTIGSITTSGTPFGYFDYVQAATTFNINITQKNPGQNPTNLALMQPAAAPGAVDTQLAATPGSTGQLDVSGLDMPISGYFTAFAPSLFTPLQAPYLTSDVFPSIFAGDVYNVLAVDLGRKVISFDPGDSVNRVDSQSVSGKNEAIILNDRDMPSISISDLPNQLRLDLEAWWGWVKLSQSFSLAIDSAATFWGQMSAASGTNVITLVNSTGILPGAPIRLRRYDNSYSEKKKVLQVIGNQITFTKNLERSYSIGDIAVSDLYWPRLIANNKKYPINLVEPRTKRWSFSLSAQENL